MGSPVGIDDEPDVRPTRTPHPVCVHLAPLRVRALTDSLSLSHSRCALRSLARAGRVDEFRVVWVVIGNAGSFLRVFIVQRDTDNHGGAAGVPGGGDCGARGAPVRGGLPGGDVRRAPDVPGVSGGCHEPYGDVCDEETAGEGEDRGEGRLCGRVRLRRQGVDDLCARDAAGHSGDCVRARLAPPPLGRKEHAQGQGHQRVDSGLDGRRRPPRRGGFALRGT